MRAPLLFLLALALNGTATGQDFQCSQLDSGKWDCARTDFHPSGPTVTKDLRESANGLPYSRTITNARPDADLIGGLRLSRNMNGSWRLVWPDGSCRTLVDGKDPLPKKLRNIEVDGIDWDILVTKVSTPTERPGIATEDEPKLDLQILRKSELPKTHTK